MENEKRLEFRLGNFGRLIPLLIALAFIFWAAVSQSNISGYVVAFFMAIIFGVAFVKDEQGYGDAIVRGLTKPMFAIVALAVVLAAISGKLISASGVVQTIASYVVSVGFSGKLFAAATFIISCLLAFATGTSVGTYFVVIPILFPIGVMAGVDPVFMVGAVVSGAAFGDNLAPVSDITIASATTQGAEVGDVVRTRVKYAVPAALIALVCFLTLTKTNPNPPVLEAAATTLRPMSLVMILVPVTIIILCLMNKHLLTALSWGVIVGVILGLVCGLFKVGDFLAFPGGFKVTGMIIESINGCIGTVAMLIAVFSLLGIMEASGLFKDIGANVSKFAKSERSGEVTIIASIGLLSMITGVMAVAIVAMGEIVKELGMKVGLDKYRRANLMDCSGCVFCFLAPWTVHSVIPAMLASQFGEAFTIAPASVPFVNYYSIGMLAILIIMVITGYGRHSKIAESKKVEI